MVKNWEKGSDIFNNHPDHRGSSHGNSPDDGANNWLSISSQPSVSTVVPGSNFDVDINVSTNTPIRSISFALSWDPAKVTCDSVEEGTFIKNFVQQDGTVTETLQPSSPKADNTTGKFPSSGSMAMVLLGGYDYVSGTSPGPTGTGNAFILHMSAPPEPAEQFLLPFQKRGLWIIIVPEMILIRR